MIRLVVLAMWDADDEAQAAEIRATLEPLGAEIQVLRFDGETLVGVDPAPEATATEQDPKQAKLISLIRQLPARTNLSKGWQTRVIRTTDEERVLAAAHRAWLDVTDPAAPKLPATGEGLQRWAVAIAEHLRDPHYATLPTIEIEPLVDGRAAIRALGVEVVYPPLTTRPQ